MEMDEAKMTSVWFFTKHKCYSAPLSAALTNIKDLKLEKLKTYEFENKLKEYMANTKLRSGALTILLDADCKISEKLEKVISFFEF